MPARDGATFTLIGAGNAAVEIEAGIADYETVYAASWKEAEPFPAFQPVLMRRLAAADGCAWRSAARIVFDRRPTLGSSSAARQQC